MSAVFEQLQQLLDAGAARYRVIEHAAEGKSDEVARIRGTLPSQGAKAMMCKHKDAKPGEGPWLLAVLPGDQKLDFRQLAAAVGIKKVTLASTEEAQQVTGCVMGAVPPFALSPDVRLVVDPALVEQHDEIAFNAGRLDRSMVLNTQDYVRIAQPLLHALCTVQADI